MSEEYSLRHTEIKDILHNPNTVKETREIKPQIPLVGFAGIPILHELEFEKIIN